MTHQIIIRPEAENDLRESFLWYEEKRQGLGHDFLLQIEAGLKFIQRNPELTPVEYKEARKRIIKKFPYKIIYLFKNDAIFVLAVLHGKRSPALLKNRIDCI